VTLSVSRARANTLNSQTGTLKVVVINDFAHVNGGAAKVAINSATALAERGYAVTFLAAVPPVASELTESPVQVVLTGQRDIKSDPNRFRAMTQGIWNRDASRALGRILAQSDRENTIVHIHGWSKALSSSVVRVAVLHGFSIVVTLHDYFYACPNGGFFNFPKTEICSLQALSLACLQENCDRDGYPQKLWRSARQLVQNEYGFLSGRIKHFICLSGLSEQVLRPYLPNDAHIYRVPHAIEFEKQEPVQVALNTKFVGVGRLSREKGFDLLAHAAGSGGAEVTLVGDGPERARIQSIEKRVRVTGWQSASGVEKHLRSARAFVLPSLVYEAQPVSVLEAAALGVPAIVPDTCAARELVDDGVTGLWFRGGDATDLAKKVAFLQDGALAARLGHAAYQKYWAAPYTMAGHIDSLELCYQLVLQSRS
jgi:glycosyltransferase involved in cell wall biosynthesis